MGISFMPEARKDLTEDELRAYALEIVQKQHRSPKKFRDYVLEKVREEYAKLSSKEIEEIERENPKLNALNKAYKNIVGEERPVFLPKKPNLSGAVVLEKLLDILRD